MATRKRNEFLEFANGDDEDASLGYNSEAEDLKKGGRSPKRRRVLNHSDASDGEDSDVPRDPSETIDHPGDSETNKKPVIDTKAQSRARHPATELPGISKPLSKKNLIATDKAIARSGVVYLSRIPPFMKPSKLRSLLSPYGSLNRIFLTPEDGASHTRRVKSGGNKKRSFTDGWVEFVSKTEAKAACELLNARPIGGKKGSYYRDDVWNLVYLRGFKWAALTEQIAAENAERASRMRAEISRTTRQNGEFVRNVERAKMLEGMENKLAAKRKRADAESQGQNQGGAGGEEKVVKKGGERQRQFKQTALAPKKTTIDQPEQVKRVLSKIF